MSNDHRGTIFTRFSEAASRVLVVLSAVSFLAYVMNSSTVTKFVAQIRSLVDKFLF